MGKNAHQGEPCVPRVVGFSWTQVDHCVYKTFILFKCAVAKCGEKWAERCYWINPDLPMCSYCFSQDLTKVSDNAGIDHLTCVECKKQVTFTIKETQDGSV